MAKDEWVEMEPAHGKHSRGNKPTKKKKKRGGCLPVLLVLVLLAVMAAGAVLLAVKGDIDGKGETGQAVSVTVEQGSGVATIANRLKSAGLIKYPRIFRFYVDHKGAAGKLQYGDFNIPEGASYDTIIEHLSQYVAAATTRVTFPEGSTALSIAAKMEEAGLCSAEEFLDVANNGDFSQFKFWQYVPAADTPGLFMRCEGYLFPETYDFYDEDTVYNYVATFYAQFESRITDEMYAELDKQGMTLHQLITLASFVQEEAGNEQDDNVAQVFRNRLAPGSPIPRLESNVSSYVQRDDDNNYLYNWVAKDYGGWDNIPAEIYAAYNTYEKVGLPAGAVSNPGIEAIKAALSPQPDEDVKDCYFFVTDLTGKYYYGRTAKEHQRNCEKAWAVNRTL